MSTESQAGGEERLLLSALLSARSREPRIRLPRATMVGRYRLRRYLGHGCECTAYLAEESATGIARVLKFYRYRSAQTVARVRRIAQTLEHLAGTQAAVRYHHMGLWLTPSGEALVYCAVEHVEGPLLSELLRQRWSERRACQLLLALCGKLVAAHGRNLAIGDFDEGHNVILVGGIDPVFCDIGFSGDGTLNRDFAGDVAALGSIAEALRAQCHPAPRIAVFADTLATVQKTAITRWALSRVFARMEAG